MSIELKQREQDMEAEALRVNAGRKPKFGDLMRNPWAGESNPQRDGYFVRSKRTTGRMNPGLWYEFTDRNGEFWETGGKFAMFIEDCITPAPTPAAAEGPLDLLRNMLNSKPLDPQFAKVLNDNLWELYADDGGDVPAVPEGKALSAKHESVMRLAAKAIHNRGHAGDTLLADSLLGILAHLKPAAPLPRQAAVQEEEGTNIAAGKLFSHVIYENKGKWIAVDVIFKRDGKFVEYWTDPSLQHHYASIVKPVQAVDRDNERIEWLRRHTVLRDKGLASAPSCQSFLDPDF